MSSPTISLQYVRSEICLAGDQHPRAFESLTQRLCLVGWGGVGLRSSGGKILLRFERWLRCALHNLRCSSFLMCVGWGKIPNIKKKISLHYVSFLK